MPRPLSLLLAFLAAVALGGCSSTPDDPAALLTGAPDRLLEAGTAQLSLRVNTSGESVPGGGYVVTADGARDFAAERTRLSLDLGPAGGQVELVDDGDVLYVRGGVLAELGAGDDQWVRLELAALEEVLGFDVGGLVQQQAGTASTVYVELLRGVTGDVEELEPGEAGGVPVRRLRFDVSLRRAANLAPPEVRDELTSLVDASGVEGTLPMQAWIDPDGLPRRVAALVELDPGALDASPTAPADGGSSPSPAAGGLVQETLLDLDAFGEPVDITVPDPAGTVDLAELIGRLGD